MTILIARPSEPSSSGVSYGVADSLRGSSEDAAVDPSLLGDWESTVRRNTDEAFENRSSKPQQMLFQDFHHQYVTLTGQQRSFYQLFVFPTCQLTLVVSGRLTHPKEAAKYLSDVSQC